jgi:lipopolysaccharide transport system ATP-binding protein
MSTIIKIEDLSKQYRLGLVSTRTLSHDLNRWWQSSILHKEDPYLKIGEVNDRTIKGESEYVWALKDIYLEVSQGDILGIIGKNGAGKSTLLKILSKVTSPTTGIVKIKGRIASLLEIGTGFHQEMTGRENIFMNGAILGMTKREIRNKLEEIVDFAGIEKYLDTPVKRYSSGMTVRLGFAVAAHLEPEILVVDEVLAVGDAEFQQKAVGKMHDVSQKEGRTVLFVSHNMGSLQNLCNNGILIENGHLIYSGNIESTVLKYLNGDQNFKMDPLLKRYDRKGNQLIKFKEVAFVDSKTMSKVQTVVSGQNIIIQFYYETQLENNSRISLGIGFNTQNGNFLFACSSESVGDIIKVNEEKTARCKIESFPLTKGVYNYDIIIYFKNVVCDHILNAGTLNVEAGDFFGTGKLPASQKSGVLINSEWSSN